MAGYHTSVAPLESIDRLRGTPCVRTKDNKDLVLLPLDFIFRTAEVQAKFDKLNIALSESRITSGKELWVTGRIDQSAVEMLKAAGWGYQEETGKKLMEK